MRKLVVAFICVFGLVMAINSFSSCTADNDDKSYEELQSIDNDEVDDDEI